MKVLWLTNKLIPSVAEAAGIKTSLVNEGWISALLSMIYNSASMELILLCGYKGNSKNGRTEMFRWYLYHEDEKDEYIYNDVQESYYKQVLITEHPDIIHLWGSEYPHSLAMVNAADSLGMRDSLVLWIQGLISVCAQPYYFYAGMDRLSTEKETYYDKIMKTSPKKMQQNYMKRGIYEMQLFHKIKHVIGRTEWDKKYTLLMNDMIRYHYCNETMRGVFYTSNWNSRNYTEHQIFVTQASYPLKGFHILLKAVGLLKKDYPDIKLRVAGYNIAAHGSIKDILKQKGYGLYIKKLFEKLKIEGNVIFLGRLNENAMKEEYLSANCVAVCSSIENSSNSVSEAMLLGVPIVASRVGGIPTLIKNDEGMLYDWEDENELAQCIKKVFEDKEFCVKLSRNSKERAVELFNPDNNYKTLMSIYKKIMYNE